jgi:CheY-like chemotaxis protein
MKTTHILIIEDDDLVARTVERSLDNDEFKVSLADNGLDGLKVARKQLPDLVILDVIMPGMDGYEVCRTMRADQVLCEVPILFLTAKIKDEDRIAGFLAGLMSMNLSYEYMRSCVGRSGQLINHERGMKIIYRLRHVKFCRNSNPRRNHPSKITPW